jgi:hypothetical protein
MTSAPPGVSTGPGRFQRSEPTSNRRGLLTVAASAVVLLSLVVGVPALLLWLDGVPALPSSLPSRDDLTATIGVEQLLTVLVWVAWLAWLQFVVCVAVELRSALRGIGLPARVPLSGPSQRLARVLVGSVLLAASAVGPAAAQQAAAPQVSAEAVVASEQPAPLAAASIPIVVTTPTEVAAANGPVEYRLGDLVLGADDAKSLLGRKVYRVQPPEGRYHDNLWDIAERELGDGRRYREIFELNRGREQPDGYELSLARLIYPHWLLIMPEDASVDRVVAVTPPPASADSDDASAPGSADQPGGPAAADQGDASDEDADQGVTAGHLATAGLLAAGLLGTIEAVRRRRRTPEPSDDGVEAEVELRIGADLERAAFLDRALRALAAACRGTGRALPPVYAAFVDTDRVELLLAPAATDASAPWQVEDDGSRWVLDRERLAMVVTDVLAPFPGLVSLGRHESGRDVLVDLEAAGGPIAVVGDPTCAFEVVTAIAAELATNWWSDHLRVTGSGLPEELTVLPDRYREVGDIGAVLPELSARRADRLGADVLTGRLHSGGSGAWMPQYVVIGAAPDQTLAAELVGLTAGGYRSPLGVVCAGDLAGARWRFSVDAAGNLDVPVLGLSVRANRLSRPTVEAVATLIAPEREVEEATVHEAWLPDVRPDIPPPPVEADSAALAMAPVRVFVLGPAEVQAAGPLDEQRRVLATELVVYLALHREGVHPTVLAGALWPRGVTQAVREATLARVREWLGQDPDGSPYLRQTADGRLRLSDDVLVDWDVVCSVLRRSRAARDHAAEADLLRKALRIARGPVLSDRSVGRYAWIARARLERLASDVLVDAAHRLSVLSFGGGEPAPAAAAARAGLRVRPAEQLLWRDLLTAEQAAHGADGVARVADELAETLAELGGVDLQAETAALLEELTPQRPIPVGNPSGLGG